ncbi:DNA alkylation repair protein [Portibacter marinus]|uniref:DNA alkylation repair protein n=1 Tax=Portibacter marinus TaxID=2898660 RepID=UPI001F214ADE|nr:DNA alkylation repair protein [Portibacter marinus]
MNAEDFSSIERLFIENQNLKKAEKMADYMKGHFQFLGISAPERKELLREVFQGFNWNRKELLEFAQHSWGSQYRELQYAGLDYLMKYRKKLIIEDIKFLEILVKTNSWWDTVDGLAVHPIGHLLIKDKTTKKKFITKWSDSTNMWLRRTAIIAQLKYKEEVDRELMEMAILKANGTKEFFLNKAIGWMLREFSKTDPEYVQVFCEQNELSNLSEREALRLVKK